jgi:hypothetical protein
MNKEANNMTRKEVLAEIELLDKKYMELPQNTEDCILDDLENKIRELEKLERLMLESEFDNKIKEVKKANEWSRNFLESFTDCKGQKISIKQADIFKKILFYVETEQNYNAYHSKSYASHDLYNGLYNSKIYEVKVFSDCGYLTKRNI